LSLLRASNLSRLSLILLIESEGEIERIHGRTQHTQKQQYNFGNEDMENSGELTRVVDVAVDVHDRLKRMSDRWKMGSLLNGRLIQ
ncbi:hypothetical protein BLOT_016664, partial [Blomia tropicalis]